jgi:phospholipid/cholesterol/gamma-HCH transport system substrate-binding protein
MPRLDKGDIAVGLAVLAALALSAGAMIWLSSPLRRDAGRGSLYTEFSNVEHLSAQDAVYLQGYQVGTVDEITPRISSKGKVTFHVRMSIQWRLADSTRLLLTKGTVAHLEPAFPVGSPSIVLDLPPNGGPPLAPESTIEGSVGITPIDAVVTLADSLTEQITLTLAKTRGALDSVQMAAGLAARGVRSTNTAIPNLAAGVARDLASLDSAIASVRGMLGPTTATADSARALLGSTRRAIDDLSHSVQGHDANIARIIANLDTTSALLQDFVRQIEAKPTRLLTGVSPAPKFNRPIH